MGKRSRRARGSSSCFCEQLERRQLLASVVQHPLPGGVLNPATPRQPSPGTPLPSAAQNIGTVVGGSPLFATGTIQANATSLRLRFGVAGPMQLTFRLSNASNGAAATLVGPDGKSLGRVGQSVPLVVSLDRGSYTLRFTSQESGAPASFALSIQPGPTAVPTDVEATAWGGNSAHLRWEDNANNELGYRIDVADPKAKGGWRRVAVAGTNHTAAVVENLQPGRQYRFRVSAVGGNHRLGIYSLAASPMTTMALTSTEDTSGYYKVTDLTYKGKGEAGWKMKTTGLTIGDTGWVYAGSWQAAVAKAVAGTTVVERTFGPKSGQNISHLFATAAGQLQSGSFEVTTADVLHDRHPRGIKGT
jgi:hypothetical protein